MLGLWLVKKIMRIGGRYLDKLKISRESIQDQVGKHHAEIEISSDQGANMSCPIKNTMGIKEEK